MSIENSKVSWFFPLGYMFGFCKIEDNGHSILVILTNRALVCWCRVCSDSTMCIFGMFSRLKMWYGKQSFGERRMLILISFDASLLNIKIFRLNKNFFSNDLIDLLHWGFRFRSWLVLVIIILNCWCFSQLKALVRVVKLFLFIILLWVEVWCTLLVMFCSCWFC